MDDILKILTTSSVPLTVKELVEKSGGKKSTVRRHAEALVRRGIVEWGEKRHRYELHEKQRFGETRRNSVYRQGSIRAYGTRLAWLNQKEEKR